MLLYTLASIALLPIAAIPGIGLFWYMCLCCNKLVKIRYGSGKWVVVGKFTSTPGERIHAEVFTKNLKKLIESSIP
jgi:hypothetical protein